MEICGLGCLRDFHIEWEATNARSSRLLEAVLLTSLMINSLINFVSSPLRHNPNDVTSNVDWTAGLKGIAFVSPTSKQLFMCLPGIEKRFVPYNGMVSDQQLDFLEKTLADSVANEVLLNSPQPPHGFARSASSSFLTFQFALIAALSHALSGISTKLSRS